MTNDFKSILAKANTGDVNSMRELGRMFRFGEGMKKNIKNAIQCFEKAAKLHDIESQFQLGYIYFSGEGVDADEKKGLYWLKKAAEQGHATSQRIIEGDYSNDDKIIHNKAYQYNAPSIPDEPYRNISSSWEYKSSQYLDYYNDSKWGDGFIGDFKMTFWVGIFIMCTSGLIFGAMSPIGIIFGCVLVVWALRNRSRKIIIRIYKLFVDGTDMGYRSTDFDWGKYFELYDIEFDYQDGKTVSVYKHEQKWYKQYEMGGNSL